MSLQTQACNVGRVAHNKSGTTVYLTDPDGVRTQHDDCIFESGRVTTSPDSGEEVVVTKPNGSFPRSSLSRVPQNGEVWAMQAPKDPLIPGVLTTFSMDSSKALEGGRSLNTIILYLSEVKQS